MTETPHMIDLVPDHKDRAYQDLLSPYKGATRYRTRALVRALGEGAQVGEENAFETFVGLSLDSATGVTLDRIWGPAVGEVRGSLEDEDYRRFIRARILANYSTGAPDDLIEIFERITEPSTVRHWNHPPRAFTLVAFRSERLSDTMAGRIKAFMKSVKPASVNMRLVEAITGQSIQYETGPGYGVGRYARLL